MTTRDQNGNNDVPSPSRSNGNVHFHSPAKASQEGIRAKLLLLVDDEPSILEVRRLLFEGLGYSVLTADSGEGALDLMQKYAVDVVVLDYLMPGMDGEETAIRIRGLYGAVPIILSTGCVSVPNHVRDLVNAAVHKGAGPQHLIDAVESQFQSRPRQDSSHASRHGNGVMMQSTAGAEIA